MQIAGQIFSIKKLDIKILVFEIVYNNFDRRNFVIIRNSFFASRRALREKLAEVAAIYMSISHDILRHIYV